MKRIVIALLAAATCASCGVGAYSVTSGKADEGAISFTASHNDHITVMVDNEKFQIQAVKTKDYKAARRLKRTAQNSVPVTSGTHTVKVYAEDGQEIYSKQLVISQSEHRIVDLHR